MSFLDEVKADCLAAEADLGHRVMVWNGRSYPVAPTTVRRGAVLVIGGREVVIGLTFRVRYDGTFAGGSTWDFTVDETPPPARGQLVHYRGTDYRIAQVINAHSTFLEIDVEDKNR